MRLSVIIPTADRPDLLLRAMSSAAVEILPGDEIIVVDDGAMPVSSAIADTVKTPGQVTMLRTAGRCGPAAARNYGAAVAKGDVILFLDDDDELLPGYAARVRTLVERHPELNFGFSSYLVRRGCDNAADTLVGHGPKISGPIPHRLKSTLAGLSCGFWVQRSTFHSIGGLDEKLRVGEDAEFCVRLHLTEKNGWYEANPGVRLHQRYDLARAAPNTSTATDSRARVGYALYIYRKSRASFPLISAGRWVLLERYIRRAVKYGFWRESLVDLVRLLPDLMVLPGLAYWAVKVISGRRY